ncbi:MAG: hypothetical protein GX143_08925 [Alcaligenaceae bacterium]|uniref:hypothetical protein n=1 Tax=Advenella sp. EE-W14 TaxID=2722705 RepID=UPI00145E1A21|nr:hypothetical protein [Advenella sp. EE-W14]NLN68265.1 hypothetical protein [Alcaligenaceae bacterium]
MTRYISYENMDGMTEKLTLDPSDPVPQNILEIKKLLIKKLEIDPTDQTAASPKTPEELIDEALDNANIPVSTIKLVIN